MRRVLTASSTLRQPSTPSSPQSDSFYSAESRILIRRSSTFERAYSPFDRLPVELHAEIFALCLDPFPHLVVGEDEPPLVIARVCRAWRALVMSTPRLWSTFEIEVVDDDSPQQPLGSSSTEPRRAAVKLLRTVKIWLERSRNYPLSIRLSHLPTSHRIPDSNHSLSAQLLAMLVSQARRWRHIEFALPSPSLSAIQAYLPEDFPVLKDLKIHMKGQWNGVPFNLRTLNIPWAQLTEVDLRLDHAHLLNLDEYLGLLSQATSLVSCSFNAICALSSSREVTPRRDAMYGSGSDIDRLHLPALQKLHMVLQDAPGVLDSNTPLTALLASQSPYLRPPQSLTSFLHRFADCKNLTHFELDWLIDSTPPLANQVPVLIPNGGFNNANHILNGNTNRNQWDTASHSSFQSFLRTLSPSLRSIRLAYLPLGEDQLLQSLAPLSVLAELDLRFSLADHEQDPVTDRFLKSLTASTTLGSSSGSSTSAPAPSGPSMVPHHHHHQMSVGSGLGSGLNLGLGLGLELSSGLRSKRNSGSPSLSPPSTSTPLPVGTSKLAKANEVSVSPAPAVVCLLPELRRIRIHCSGEQCTQQALLELVRSRVRASPIATSATNTAIRGNGRTAVHPEPLEQFHFCSMSPVLRDTPRYVDEWTKLGVDVRIESVIVL